MSYPVDTPHRVHDLILLRSADVETACMVEPPWVRPALQHTPWAVVRRAPAPNGKLAVGVRGTAREERWGGLIELSKVVLTKRPSQLRCSLAHDSRRTIPALKALTFVETVLAHMDLDWGPAGSVGFELATGKPVATEGSDLDVVLFTSRRIDAVTARDLWLALAASPTKVDLRIETPLCGFSLEEYARSESAKILIRMPSGRQLVEDPWALPDERETK
jgi:phosphoribosyl-dephospho-CoA transferase